MAVFAVRCFITPTRRENLVRSTRAVESWKIEWEMMQRMRFNAESMTHRGVDVGPAGLGIVVE